MISLSVKGQITFFVNAQETDPTDLCSRTEVVKNEIVSRVSGKSRCEDITNEDLSGIIRISLISQEVGSLNSGDFAGLTGLTRIFLGGNQLTTLPADIFSGLSALGILDLKNNQLTTLPSGIFSGLTALTDLDLSNNPLTSLPTSIFDDLPSTATKTLPDGVTINATVPISVGMIDNITDLVANGSPRVVNVATKFSDPNDTLTLTATSNNTAIATVTVMDSIVTVTPVATGSATITVTATDIAGQTAEQTFTVTVNATPTTVGTITDITDLVLNGSSRNVDVATNFSDPNDTLTFTAMSDNTAIATVTVDG